LITVTVSGIKGIPPKTLAGVVYRVGINATNNKMTIHKDPAHPVGSDFR